MATKHARIPAANRALPVDADLIDLTGGDLPPSEDLARPKLPIKDDVRPLVLKWKAARLLKLGDARPDG